MLLCLIGVEIVGSVLLQRQPSAAYLRSSSPSRNFSAQVAESG